MTGPAQQPDGGFSGAPQIPPPPRQWQSAPRPQQAPPHQSAPLRRPRPRGLGPALAAMIVLTVGLAVLLVPWLLFLAWHFVILMGAPYHVVSSTVGLWAGMNMWSVPPVLVAVVVLAIVALVRRDRRDPRTRMLAVVAACALVGAAVVTGILLLEIPLLGVQVCSSTRPCS